MTGSPGGARTRCAWRIAAAQAVLVPLLAWPQLYRCEGPDGRSHFTDKPCGSDARPMELPPDARPTYEMEVDARTGQKLATPLTFDYYVIRGTTLAELSREVNAKAIETRWGKATGLMKPRLGWSYETLSDRSGRCTITKISVVADSTVWIPRWANASEAAARVQDVVNTFLRRVEEHERGHVAIHVETGQEIVQSLRAIPAARSCDEIRTEAEWRASTLWQRSVARQLDYDRRTDHGRAP